MKKKVATKETNSSDHKNNTFQRLPFKDHKIIESSFKLFEQKIKAQSGFMINFSLRMHNQQSVTHISSEPEGVSQVFSVWA